MTPDVLRAREEGMNTGRKLTMHKLSLFALVAVVCFGMVLACSSQGQGKQTEPVATEADEPTPIVIVVTATPGPTEPLPPTPTPVVIVVTATPEPTLPSTPTPVVIVVTATPAPSPTPVKGAFSPISSAMRRLSWLLSKLHALTPPMPLLAS